jgi:hypothetical protein
MKKLQYFHRIISVGVVDNRQTQTLFGGNENASRHLRCEMGRRNKVDVVTALRLKLEHYFSQALVGNFVLELLFVCLRDLIVLTIDTAEITVAEENVSRAVLPN